MSAPLTAGELGVARRNLSKSKLMAFRQCHRRLWLEVHHPELRDDSDAAKSRFEAGYRVGEVARRIYDPTGRGVAIDPRVETNPGKDEPCSRAIMRFLPDPLASSPFWAFSASL